jgi:hypothetical protein
MLTIEETLPTAPTTLPKGKTPATSDLHLKTDKKQNRILHRWVKLRPSNQRCIPAHFAGSIEAQLLIKKILRGLHESRESSRIYLGERSWA